MDLNATPAVVDVGSRRTWAKILKWMTRRTSGDMAGDYGADTAARQPNAPESVDEWRHVGRAMHYRTYGSQ